MANKNDNLIPQAHVLTVEEQSAGGKASAKARRERADLRRALQVFLESDATTDKNGEPLSGAELMVKVAVREATRGNPKFWELIRDTAGQKPVEKVMIAEVEQSVIDEVERAVLDDAPASD